MIMGDDDGNKQAFFYLEEKGVIPKDVTRVRVHPSVKRIQGAFYYREKLMSIIFNDGLEVIGRNACEGCSSLRDIEIPPLVKTIEREAFSDCTGLTTVNLGEGLEEIGKRAFEGCTSLQEITIPPAVKVIGAGAFLYCEQMTTVNLCEGLEALGNFAFSCCKMLQEITIPSAVRVI